VQRARARSRCGGGVLPACCADGPLAMDARAVFPFEGRPLITNRSCIEGKKPSSSKRARSEPSSPVHTLYFVPHDTARFLAFSAKANLLPHPSLQWLLETQGYRVVTYGLTTRLFDERFSEEFTNALGAYHGFRLADALRFEVAPDTEPTVHSRESVLKQALNTAGEAGWLDTACGRVAEARGRGFAHARALLLQRLYMLGLLPLRPPSGAGPVKGWAKETAILSPLAWEMLRACGGSLTAPFLAALLPATALDAGMVGLKVDATEAALRLITNRSPAAFATLVAVGGGDSWRAAVVGKPEAARWRAVAQLTDLELERQLFLATQRLPAREWRTRDAACAELVAALAAPLRQQGEIIELD